MRQIYCNRDEEIEVIRGSFIGLKYLDFLSIGSSLCPKLWMYEKELSDIFEEIIEKRYEYILDIGCVEGYYAVGLLKKEICEHKIVGTILATMQDHYVKVCAE